MLKTHISEKKHNVLFECQENEKKNKIQSLTQITIGEKFENSCFLIKIMSSVKHVL